MIGLEGEKEIVKELFAEPASLVHEGTLLHQWITEKKSNKAYALIDIAVTRIKTIIGILSRKFTELLAESKLAVSVQDRRNFRQSWDDLNEAIKSLLNTAKDQKSDESVKDFAPIYKILDSRRKRLQELGKFIEKIAKKEITVRFQRIGERLEITLHTCLSGSSTISQGFKEQLEDEFNQLDQAIVSLGLLANNGCIPSKINI